jgi:alpha-glucuronidase
MPPALAGQRGERLSIPRGLSLQLAAGERCNSAGQRFTARQLHHPSSVSATNATLVPTLVNEVGVQIRFVVRLLIAAPALASLASAACAEDGYDLWLRYRPVEQSWRDRYAPHATGIVVDRSSPTLEAAAAELERGVSGLLGHRLGRSPLKDGAIVLATNRNLGGNGNEGFVIRSTLLRGHRVTLIAARRDVGVLYGAFAFLRLMQTRQDTTHLNITEAPKLSLRTLNHWDNLDRTVERGYAGPSIWDWTSLPKIDPRYVDYARANASIGINGVVLNNVNADPRVLTPEYLAKVAALARLFRPYGIHIYLTARFSSPVQVGGLTTADPLDPRVKAWWRAKADAIYQLIPDFGGLLVKANSEGQPGPRDYNRTQADGANVIAEALAPHGGTVFWRAFVYGGSKEDRAKQAYDEFRPLDGKFRSNVIVQVKNGPIDFQPREPFHPLFGQMPHTRVGLEVQLTREYLGQSDGAVFLAPMWTEVLDADTCSPRCGTPVKATIAAMAGVSNVGSKRDWTAANFDQANWYTFGRLAWDPMLSPERIADEWTRMTWSNGPRAVKPIVAMMMGSREAVVDYMTPLGLTHQFQNDHHSGPAPWSCGFSEPSWNPCYYNKAGADGIGFDRTASGSDAVVQYAPPVARCLTDPKCICDKDLLFFHHLPWTYRMRDGRTLWESLIKHYDRGVGQVEADRRAWAALRPFIDGKRFAAVSADLGRQVHEAWWWRDASIAYWQSLSKLPLPPGHSAPAHSLSWYQAIHFDRVPGFLSARINPRIVCVAGRGETSCAQ